MTSAYLVLLGAAVGVLSALMGIGGGIVLVPALVLLFGLSQAEAQGTSLATIPLGAIVAAGALPAWSAPRLRPPPRASVRGRRRGRRGAAGGGCASAPLLRRLRASALHGPAPQPRPKARVAAAPAPPGPPALPEGSVM